MRPEVDPGPPGRAGPGAEAAVRSPLAWAGVYLRGMAMGVAELVPGVSGGTIAFITGIYVELVRSIRSLTPALAATALRGKVARAWREGNLGFLALLGLGMVTSIFGFASLVAWFLDHRDIYLWAFFFGLIVASAVYVGRYVRPWTPPRAVLAALGVAVGAVIANVQPLPAPEHWISTVLAGGVAICAWILPGVSGSYMLLLLGQYEPLVRALNELDLVFLAALATGMAGGLLAFARFLVWLLRGWYEATLAFLCGFMAGSLQKLWPWREAVTPHLERPISPGAWEAATGLDPLVPGAVGAAALAASVVLGLHLLSKRRGGDPAAAGFAADPPT